MTISGPQDPRDVLPCTDVNTMPSTDLFSARAFEHLRTEKSVVTVCALASCCYRASDIEPIPYLAIVKQASIELATSRSRAFNV